MNGKALEPNPINYSLAVPVGDTIDVSKGSVKAGGDGRASLDKVVARAINRDIECGLLTIHKKGLKHSSVNVPTSVHDHG